MTSPAPRYDRIASLVLVISLGLAVVLFIDINPNILRARIGGDVPPITVSWLLIAVLTIIASTGADLLARAHPAMQSRSLPVVNLGLVQSEVAPGFWIMPSFSVIGAFALFRVFSASLQGAAFVLALVGAGGLLLTVLTAQHYALDRSDKVRQRAQLVLQVVGYMLAFACFSAIYFERFRTLYSATLIGGTAALLGYALLRWQARRGVVLLAGFLGLVLAEATWALNYWPAHFLLGGALLLLIFYVAVNVLHYQLTNMLSKRIIVEYGLIGSVLLGAIVYITFLAG